MTSTTEQQRSAAFHNLQADLADATDQVDQLLFDLLLDKPVAGDLGELKQDIDDLFGTAPDISAQRFRCKGGLEGLVVFDQGLIHQELLVLGVLRPLARAELTPADAADPAPPCTPRR